MWPRSSFSLPGRRLYIPPSWHLFFYFYLFWSLGDLCGLGELRPGRSGKGAVWVRYGCLKRVVSSFRMQLRPVSNVFFSRVQPSVVALITSCFPFLYFPFCQVKSEMEIKWGKRDDFFTWQVVKRHSSYERKGDIERYRKLDLFLKRENNKKGAKMGK